MQGEQVGPLALLPRVGDLLCVALAVRVLLLLRVLLVWLCRVRGRGQTCEGERDAPANRFFLVAVPHYSLLLTVALNPTP